MLVLHSFIVNIACTKHTLHVLYLLLSPYTALPLRLLAMWRASSPQAGASARTLLPRRSTHLHAPGTARASAKQTGTSASCCLTLAV